VRALCSLRLLYTSSHVLNLALLLALCAKCPRENWELFLIYPIPKLVNLEFISSSSPLYYNYVIYSIVVTTCYSKDNPIQHFISLCFSILVSSRFGGHGDWRWSRGFHKKPCKSLWYSRVKAHLWFSTLYWCVSFGGFSWSCRTNGENCVRCCSSSRGMNRTDKDSQSVVVSWQF
jgi:hypothetical protein